MTDLRGEKIFYGNGVSAGVVTGRALKLDSHNRLILKLTLPDDHAVANEIRRFDRAIESSREQLRVLRARLEEKIGSEHSFILDAHLLMLEDQSLLEEIRAVIRSKRANAEWAVREAADPLIRAYESLEDQYFRERSSDIENVVERILINLSDSRPFNWDSLPDDLIVVCHDFNPSSFALVDFRKLRGLALESGGRTSHTAIIARSIGLAAVMEIRDLISSVASGDLLLLNGDEGQLVINPSAERLVAMREPLEHSLAKRETSLSQSADTTMTRDGVSFGLLANTELPHEGKVARSYGAQGIGLFRSEYLFFRHPTGLPSMEEQCETYRRLAVEMHPYPVAVRTLDTGFERFMTSITQEPAPNPSMGLRGIRMSLLTRDSFRAQIEAILRASVAGTMEIVLPMISTVAEIRETRKVIESVRDSILHSGGAVSTCVPLGAMIEVPATVLTLDVLAQEADFFCVGTNDLIQYMLAVDRDNPQVAHLYQPLHPSILKCLSLIATVSRRVGKSVRICGEISANPFFSVLLLGMGFNQLSMNALAIPTIRQVLCEISVQSARDLVNRIMTFSETQEIADYLIGEVSRMVSVNLLPFIKEIRTFEPRNPVRKSS